MNTGSQVASLPRFKAPGLVALVVILGFAFVAAVLVPGLELAGELTDSTMALKYVGQQQRNPTLVRASLDAMRDRLTNRGYIQESLDQLRDASAKLDAAIGDMTSSRTPSLLAFAGLGASGEPVAGRHAAMLRDLWAKQRETLTPLLGFKGVPYEDNEATGTALNEAGHQLEHDVNAAIRTAKRSVPGLDDTLTAIVADLQSSSQQAATRLRLVMLTGLLIAAVLVTLVTLLLLARKRQDASLRAARQQTADIFAHRERRLVPARSKLDHR